MKRYRGDVLVFFFYVMALCVLGWLHFEDAKRIENISIERNALMARELPSRISFAYYSLSSEAFKTEVKNLSIIYPAITQINLLDELSGERYALVGQCGVADKVYRFNPEQLKLEVCMATEQVGHTQFLLALVFLLISGGIAIWYVYLLQKTMQAKNLFIASMSHHFKSPIVNMEYTLAKLVAGITKANCNALSDAHLAEKSPGLPATSYLEDKRNQQTLENIQYLSALKRLVAQMSDTVYSTIEEAMIDAGEAPGLLCDWFNLETEIIGSIQTFLLVAERQNNQILLSASGFEDLEVYTDRRRLLQCFNNLVSNANKYCQDGTIVIRLDFSSSHWLSVSVEDTGVGIAKQQYAKVLSPYQSAEKRYAESTGVGLHSIAASLKQLGSKIEFDSPGAGKGARFWFNFPIQNTRQVTNCKEPSGFKTAYIGCTDATIKAHLATLSFNLFGVQQIELKLDVANPPNYIFIHDLGLVANNGNPQVNKQLMSQMGVGRAELSRCAVHPNTQMLLTCFTPTENLQKLHLLMGLPAPRALHDLYYGQLICQQGAQTSLLSTRQTHPVLGELRILIVDDDPDYTENMVDVLKQNGIAYVDSQLSAYQGVRMAIEQHYDVVFMDHMMKGMTGVEASSIIKEVKPNQVIFGFSAAKNVLYHNSIQEENGMDQVFAKSFMPNDIALLLQALSVYMHD